MPYEFYGDETLLTSHEASYFSLLTTSAKLMIFNVMKLSMKLSLRLALDLKFLHMEAKKESPPITPSNSNSKVIQMQCSLFITVVTPEIQLILAN